MDLSATLFLLISSFFIIQSIEISDKQKEELSGARDACIGIHKPPEQSLIDLRQAKYIYETDESVKCFLNCFGEKVGMFKDGVVQEDAILQNLGPIFGSEQIERTIETCRHTEGGDKCDKAYNLYICYHKLASIII